MGACVESFLRGKRRRWPTSNFHRTQSLHPSSRPSRACSGRGLKIIWRHWREWRSCRPLASCRPISTRSSWKSRATRSTATGRAAWRCAWPSRSHATRWRWPRRLSSHIPPSDLIEPPVSRAARLHQPAPGGRRRPARAGARTCWPRARTFGRSDGFAGHRALVEFVSANPTGPLHIGHGRGAVIGDSLARIFAAAGYEVTREYYYNDAGVQMRHAGRVAARALPAGPRRGRPPSPRTATRATT